MANGQYGGAVPCAETHMTRTYTLKKRAEQQAGTRQRIVESAVDLHGSVGPALTSLSMIAERAGVQRHTLYAHFPDERSLFLACSGLTLERDPLPDAAAWRTGGDGAERLRIGLLAIYGWYERNADLAACVLRDAEYHPLDERDRRIAVRPVHGGLSGGARSGPGHGAAVRAEAGPQLLHMADPGPRERARTGGGCQSHGPSDQLRQGSMNKGVTAALNTKPPTKATTKPDARSGGFPGLAPGVLP